MSLSKLLKKIKDKNESRSSVLHIEKAISQLQGGSFSLDDLDLKSLIFKDNLKEEIRSKEMGLDGPTRHNRLMAFMDLYTSMNMAYDGSGKDKFHPSSLHSECERKLFYDLTKTPYSNPHSRVIPPTLQLIFDTGTFLHLYLQYCLHTAGVLKECEVTIKDAPLLIEGKADGLLHGSYFGLKEDVMLEIKSMNSFSFNNAKKHGVFHKHKEQAFVYAKSGGYKHVLFLYICKDNSEMIDFLEEVDDKVYTPIREKMDRVIEAKESRIPLPRECGNKNDKNALECPYRTHCFKIKTTTDAEVKKERSSRKPRAERKPRVKRTTEVRQKRVPRDRNS